MNERIRELAEQAVQLVADKHTKGDVSRLNTDSYQVKDLIQQKFAELLIRECAKSAYDWYENHHNFHWDPATHVLGHFGVEP